MQLRPSRILRLLREGQIPSLLKINLSPSPPDFYTLRLARYPASLSLP